MSRRATQNKSPKLEIKQDQIPTFCSDVVQSLTVRYYVLDEYPSDVSSVTVELPQVPYGVSYSGSAAILPFKSVRISKIEMWCNYRPSVGIAGNTISLTQVERRTVRPIEWSDTATFLTPAHICKHFNKNEPVGLWYATTSGESNPELRFQLPKGALLEITFSYVLSDGEGTGVSSGTFSAYPRVFTNCLSTDYGCVGKSFVAVLSA